ncbi:hypothetical protein GCM10023320_82040 [Pseudonocardia adelaidensis]|uniref:Transposase IS701-like DDE domain-containing protein n=1 Tax=Pseudonocardia adelaidensis TaxID=648754 RepID=A0ABP9P7N1_9PSEU
MCSTASSPRTTARKIDGGWGLPERTVVADGGYGDATEFRLCLAERGLDHVVAVTPTIRAYPSSAVPTAPPYTSRGRSPTPRYRPNPINLAGPAPAGLRRVTWRHGSRKKAGNPTAAMRSTDPGVLHTVALRPESPCAGLTPYAVLRELQTLHRRLDRRLPHLPTTLPPQTTAHHARHDPIARPGRLVQCSVDPVMLRGPPRRSGQDH